LCCGAIPVSTLLANLSILLIFVVAAVLHSANEYAYDWVAREDGVLEWATFWAFVVAATLFGRNALYSKRSGDPYPWFAIGLAAFCLFVAMEEISWGQRIFGGAPPAFFLERNYQQELNFHNLIETDYRALIVQIVLLGYGVLLSAAAMHPRVRQLLSYFRIVAPPIQLAVSFLVVSAMYAWYPWSLTGEWVELAMGTAFVYVAIWGAADITAGTVSVVQIMKSLAIVGLLTGLTLVGLGVTQSADPEDVARAESEVSALADDFSGPHLHTRCGIHKRLYTFAVEYGQSFLFDGNFAKLLVDSGANKRAAFVLDPWHSAYWLNHHCSQGRTVRFIYSFGPNRLRDSTDWEIAGDDVGVYLHDN